MLITAEEDSYTTVGGDEIKGRNSLRNFYLVQLYLLKLQFICLSPCCLWDKSQNYNDRLSVCVLYVQKEKVWDWTKRNFDLKNTGLGWAGGVQSGWGKIVRAK